MLEPLGALLAALLLAVSSAGAVSAGGAAARSEARVDRVFPVTVASDYARAHHDYPATDVFAACRSRVVAPVDGTVLEVSRTDRWDPGRNRGAQRGGKFVSIRGRDGVRYYLSHFSRVRADLEPGARLRAGEGIARVGHTGSARGTPCHVHVGLSPVCAGTGDWRVRRGAVRPYRFLRSWEDGGNLSPRRAVLRWERERHCP